MRAIALELADGRTISGTCDPQFAGVLAEFRTNFAERKEVGASVSITHHGRTMVGTVKLTRNWFKRILLRAMAVVHGLCKWVQRQLKWQTMWH